MVSAYLGYTWVVEVARNDSGRRTVRRAGLVGALLGAAAAGAAAGVAVERFLLRRPRRPVPPEDPYAGERFGQLPFDESMTVHVDGIDIYAEVVEPNDGIDLDFGDGLGVGEPGAPDPTLIFVHGFCLDMGSYHFQRTELARRGGYRMVFYDQPGHGRSGKRAGGEYSLDELGEALRRVIDATSPDAPVVLIGHSLGGMTIMALAEAYPELFVDRVRGVVFLSTSAGKLDEVTFGMPDFVARFSRPLVPVITGAGRLTGGLIDRLRRASTDLALLLTRRYGFGSEQPSPTLVSFVEQMNTRTGTEVLARYLRTIYTHARYPALEALRRVPTLVICGDQDKLTPASHSAEICRALPDAVFVPVPGAGHVVPLERPEVVNAALLDFLERID